MDKLTKKVRHNFFIGYNMIFKQKISEHAKIVYLYLCRCADGQEQAFPSHSNIGENCSISRRTVIDAIKELEAIGLVSKQTQITKNGGQSSNLYTITDTPCAGDAHPPVQEMHTPCAGDAHELDSVKYDPTLSTTKSSQSQSQTDTDNDTDLQRGGMAIKKEPPTVATSRGSRNTTQDNNAYVSSNRTTEEAQAQYEKAQQQLEIVKDNIDYYFIEDDSYQSSVDSLLASMEEVFMSNDSTIKIGKRDIPRQAVISTYLKLDTEHIDHVLNRFASVRNPIKHPHAYMKTCLYRAYQEYDTYIQNLASQHGY